jgi:hypothetical protein
MLWLTLGEIMFGFLKKKVKEETPDTFVVGGLLFSCHVSRMT